MNINQLEYLKELLLRGSFTLAAESLGISQPALSIQIRKLEEEADLSLIDRTAKPIRLTDDGKIYYELVSEILDRVKELKELSVNLSEKISGSLKLGIIPTLAPYLVPEFIEELNKQYPDLELIIEEQITETIIRRIKTGFFDAGIFATPVQAKGLGFRTLFYEKFFLYVSEKHPLYSLEEIPIENIDLDEVWYLQEGNCFSSQVNSICSRTRALKSSKGLTYFSNSIESLRRIVEQKEGITFIPELATIEVPLEFEEMIKPIQHMDPIREISLVSRTNPGRKRMLDALVEVILSQIPARMKTKPSGWIVDTDIEVT